ncbi:MAG TPA: flagellar motor switch protein FliG [Anaerolineae bacterium]|nr:flagellar motor switch protein FliG [Anaerolineae bacterium]
MASKITLTGAQKAAMLLISLGPERSAVLLKGFDDEDIERLTREITTMRRVVPEVQAEVFAECYSRIGSEREALTGGHEYARDMLVRALGERKASELLERIFSNRIAPFVFMGDGDPLQIANFLRDEHPQTVAVVLSHLSARQAAAVLANFEPDLQCEIATRIAKMDRIAPEVLAQIEHGLQIKFASVLTQDYSLSGGPDFLVTVLTQIDRSAEKGIIEHLESTDQALAEEIRGKMFVFEDITQLDNQSIQRLLKELDRRELAKAMKATTAAVRELIFGNMSTRAREMLEEEIDLLGAIRLSAVERAQRGITDIIRRLEAENEIFIARGQDQIIM